MRTLVASLYLSQNAFPMLFLTSPARLFHRIHSHPSSPFCRLHLFPTRSRLLHQADPKTSLAIMSSVATKNGEEAMINSSGRIDEREVEAGAELRTAHPIYLAVDSDQHADFLERLRSGDQLGLILPEGAAVFPANQVREDVESGGGFRIGFFMNCLRTSSLGKVLLYSPCLPSTQTLLSQNFHAMPHGVVCVADSQHQGKGRAGNTWVSPKGCLLFSFTLQMDNGRILPFLQYVVSLAIVEAVDMICLNKQMRALDLRIKWPNDIYAKGVKVGGVLCTSTYSASKFNIVVGVGLNVKNQEPTTCLDSLVQEFNSALSGFSLEEILAAILWKFESLYKVFIEQGFSSLESAYYRYWLHSGQKVQIEEDMDKASGRRTFVTIEGLTSSGFLLAVDEHLEQYELHPDGNSFDFLHGLVRKKLQV